MGFAPRFIELRDVWTFMRPGGSNIKIIYKLAIGLQNRWLDFGERFCAIPEFGHRATDRTKGRLRCQRSRDAILWPVSSQGGMLKKRRLPRNIQIKIERNKLRRKGAPSKKPQWHCGLKTQKHRRAVPWRHIDIRTQYHSGLAPQLHKFFLTYQRKATAPYWHIAILT